VVVLSGDFKQVLPVVPRASRAGIVRASMKSSPLWNLFATHTLTENMRILANGNDRELIEWDELLLRIGEGTEPTLGDTDLIKLPADRTMVGSLIRESLWVAEGCIVPGN
jgi:hypothetical protein